MDPKLFGSAQAAVASAEQWKGVIQSPHFPIKAKRVIHLCMAGGPSHLETFDWKPELKALDGKPFPESFTKGQQLAQLQNTELKARGAFTEFKKCGKAGIEISNQFPHIQSVADDLCVIRSMQTEQINHDPAHAFMNTGSIIKGRPSMGSWLLYGLGADTDDLPGFIVFTSQGKSACNRSRRGNGRAASCRANFRASNFNPRATRCITSATQRASARARNGRSSRKSTG